MDIKIKGDRWGWKIEYDDGKPQSFSHGKHEYGDTNAYNGETQEELEVWAKKAWSNSKNIVDNLK